MNALLISELGGIDNADHFAQIIGLELTQLIRDRINTAVSHPGVREN
jgi:hypothetical protein